MSFVHGEILKQCTWEDDELRLSHHRDKDQLEIEIIIVIENSVNDMVGIEVKAAASVQRRDVLGLERLTRANDDCFRCGVVLYEGDEIVPFGHNLFAASLACLWS